MDNLGDRIKFARQNHPDGKMTQGVLAKSAGISQTTIADIERGRNSGSTKIVDIARVLKVSVSWLNSGKGDMRTGAQSHINTEPVEIKGMVPLISWVAAGKWCNVDNPYEVGDAEDWVVCPVKHSSKTYALRVKGDSMHNHGGNESFSDGDLIFVDPERGYSHRSYVVVHIDNENQATFKRLLIDGDRKMLEALNPSWPERIFEIKKDATICGVVIAKVVSLV